jgi:hypothetical protein
MKLKKIKDGNYLLVKLIDKGENITTITKGIFCRKKELCIKLIVFQ